MSGVASKIAINETEKIKEFFAREKGFYSAKELKAELELTLSYPSIKRILQRLQSFGVLECEKQKSGFNSYIDKFKVR